MGFKTATTKLFRACAPGGLALALALAGCTGQIIEDTSGPVPPLTDLGNGVPVGGRGGQMPNSDSAVGGAGTTSSEAGAGGGAAPSGPAGTAGPAGVGGATGGSAANGGGTTGIVGTSSGGGATGDGPAPMPEPPPSPMPAPAVNLELTGTVVPLYSYPTNAAWRTVIDAKLAHPTVPVVAVVNPANGPGA